jgi:hypothetical protein
MRIGDQYTCLLYNSRMGKAGQCVFPCNIVGKAGWVGRILMRASGITDQLLNWECRPGAPFEGLELQALVDRHDVFQTSTSPKKRNQSIARIGSAIHITTAAFTKSTSP